MKFQNSNELHEFLNQNPDSISNAYDITSIIKKSIESLDVETNKAAILKLDLERAILSFGIEESNLKPKHSYQDDQGHLVSYPSINGFSKEDIEQIDELFKASSSNLINAHYGHFLWIKGKRHTEYLEKTIKGYTDFITEILRQNKVEPENPKKNSKYHNIRYLLSQLIFLSQKKRDTVVVRQLILDTLNDSDHEFLFYSLALLMLESKKVFQKKDYEFLIPKCLAYVRNIESPFQKISFYELGARIDQRQNTKSENWAKLIGQQYEVLANKRTDIAAITFANKATRYYEEGGESKAAERMAKLYKEKSETKELGKFGSRIDITDYVKYIDDVINQLSKAELKEIIIFLSQSPSIIPHKNFLDDMVASVGQGNTMRFFMSNYVYDSNGHIAQHFTTQEEITYMLTLENYAQVMTMRFDALVNRLIIELLDRDDWTADNFLDALTEKSWYGQIIHKPLDSTRAIDIKMIEYIRPGIVNYFDELRKYKNDKKYQPDFTLCIDSLTLKVEVILREICIQIGVRTFYIKKDNSKREVTKEKDINMLLREEKLVQFLGEDFILYLKALLVERVGGNLRNKVAHGFLFPIQYKNFTLINKVLIALLRLSIWKIGGIKDEEE